MTQNAISDGAVSGIPLLAVVGAGADDLVAQLERAGALEPATGALERAGKALWEAGLSELAEVARGFLGADLGGLLVVGLQRTRELVEAGRATRGTADRVLVDLTGRELTVVQHPTVDVMVGPRRLAEIPFELRLVVTLAALAAVVRDGRLVELTSGTGQATVTLSTHGEVVASGSRPFDPHLTVRLGDGVRLVPDDTAVLTLP
ncbi:hypothetical protein [Angustibacter luteus]|uniref:Uncharacterized protein n=1 Tax=Angustibacter luteus TaxID=658456 RepID=A0ABW1JHE4_9ACTN